MKARNSAIVRQRSWIFHFMNCLYDFAAQQLTTWANMRSISFLRHRWTVLYSTRLILFRWFILVIRRDSSRQDFQSFPIDSTPSGHKMTSASPWYLFFKWANPGHFFIYFRLFKHTLQFFQQINVKMSIQYMVQGLELMTFSTWDSSHNH